MNADPIEREIRDFILRRPRGKALRVLHQDDSLFALGVLDSMAVVSLVAFCEQRFGIEIADGELAPENFQSVGALARLVRRSPRINDGQP